MFLSILRRRRRRPGTRKLRIRYYDAEDRVVYDSALDTDSTGIPPATYRVVLDYADGAHVTGYLSSAHADVPPRT